MFIALREQQFSFLILKAFFRFSINSVLSSMVTCLKVINPKEPGFGKCFLGEMKFVFFEFKIETVILYI